MLKCSNFVAVARQGGSTVWLRKEAIRIEGEGPPQQSDSLKWHPSIGWGRWAYGSFQWAATRMYG